MSALRRLLQILHLAGPLLWAAALLPALVIFLTYSGWEQSRIEEHQAARRLATLRTLSSIRLSLQSNLNGNYLMAKGLAALLATEPDMSEETYATIARSITQGATPIRNLTYLRGTVIRYVYPELFNSRAKGTDLATIPAQRASVQRAIRTRRPIVTGPVDLVQGGRGIITRIPIPDRRHPFPDDSGPIVGQLSIVVDVATLFRDTESLCREESLTLAIVSPATSYSERRLLFGPEWVFRSSPITLPMPLPEGSWLLAAVPRDGWAPPPDIIHSWRAWGAGLILLALTLGLAACYHVGRLRQEELSRHHLEAQLQEAQRMESIGRLAGGVAHDFNNLLTALLGYTDLMQDELPKERSLQEHLGHIRQAGERARDLTRQLLAIGRRQVLEILPIDLNGLVQEYSPLLRRVIREDIQLEILTAEIPCIIEADPSQIGQILLNLVVNARDAMPEGGTLRIRTAIPEEPPLTTSLELAAGSLVELAVEDTGVGMDAPTMERAFEPFFTTKPKGVGTGLGLSTVYGIIKQHRGDIAVESTPGHGTTIRIFFPRSFQSSHPMESPAESTAAADGKTPGRTVLVLEDDDSVRSLVIRILERLDLQVLSSADPQEALLISENHPGPIHLLITDVIMPGLNGLEVSRRIQSQRPGIPCLFMSGYEEDILSDDGILQPDVCFLQKPFPPDQLRSMVLELLKTSPLEP